MAQRKGTSRGRRRQAAKAPVIDLEASEVAEQPDETATGTDAPSEEATNTPTAAEDEPAAQDKEESAETAAEETAEPTAETTEADASTEDPKSSGRGKLIAAGVAALLLAGAAGGAWLYKDVGANYFPSANSERQAAQLAELQSRLANLEAANGSVSETLTKLTSQIDALNKKIDDTASTAAAQATAKADKAASLAQQAADQAAQAMSEAGAVKSAASDAMSVAQGAQAASDQMSAELKSAQTGITELKTAIAAAAESASSLTGDAGESVKAAQAQISGLTLKLAELERKLDAAPTQPQADPAIADKLGQLEQSVATLKANLTEALKTQHASAAAAGKQATRDRMVQALSDLTTSANSGQPFTSALAALEPALGSDPAFAALSAVADKGVPTTKALLDKFESVRSALAGQPSSPAPSEDANAETEPSSFFSSLQSRLSSVIKIRPSGTKDWAKLGDELGALAQKGQLSEMVQLAGTVPETLPDALAAWLAEARSRVELDRNVAAVSTKTMDHLATTSKTGG
ncbi:MAG: hypothetical protein AAGF86_01880 [Pseudomonadota bacterium]